MELSSKDIKYLSSVVFKAGANAIYPMAGDFATSASEFFAQRDENLNHLGTEQAEYCRDVQKQVVKSIKKNYETWLKGARSEGRTDDNVKAALINLPAALEQANISVKDMMLSEDAFTTKILGKLKSFSEYKDDETARNMFVSLILLMRDVANIDVKLKPFFALSRYENIIGAFDAAQADSDKKHQEVLEAIAKEKGVPLENLEPLFKAVEHQMPNATDSNFIKLVSDAVDALLVRANEKVEIFNDSREIDIAIRDAREQLKKLDTEAALKTLEMAQKHASQDAARAAVERAEIYKDIYDWDEAIQAYQEAAELDKADAWYYFEIGDIWELKGNLTKSLENYEFGQQVASHVAHQRDLSVSYERIANILAQQGQLADALIHYETSQSIRKDLMKSEPRNMDLQRDLSVSYNKIADILAEQGQLADALTHYETSRSIRKDLAKSDASNMGLQRDLSVSYDNIADILTRQGHLADALTHYETSQSIRKDLAKSDASNMGLQRDLSVSYDKIADILARQGQLADALIHYQTSQSIRKDLAKSDAINMGLQRDLWVSYNKIADILARQGQMVDARTHYEISQSIAEELAKSDPSNMGLQRDLSVSYERIADMLTEQGQLADALTHCETSLTIAMDLAKSDPSNMILQRDLIVSYVKIASLGKDEVHNYEAALRISRHMHSNGLLAPVDEWMVEDLEQRLVEAEAKEI
ncbi:MAG: hypothetical protein COC24_011725 [Alphaproteobacteria bacterium]|nr:hypothetical protein [Alphaproteobacteria bacterium]